MSKKSGKKVTIEFFYDVVSPWSYIGYEIVRRIRNNWNVEIKCRPFYLSGIMNLSGNKPPVTVPAKGVYSIKDLERVTKYHNISSLNLPSRFPLDTLRVMRFLYIVNKEDTMAAEKFAYHLWRKYWIDDIDITLVDVWKEISAKIGIPDDKTEKWIEKSKGEEAKNGLRKVTEEAIARGAFGAPTFFILKEDGSEEMYFGSDRFHIMASELGEKWVDSIIKAKL